VSTSSIVRSVGLPIEVAGLPTGYIAGGGYRGATDELDATVQAAAELLADAYRMPVTIRFNSDRRSGGAWLRTDEIDSFRANAEIGICARLVDERSVASIREQAERWQRDDDDPSLNDDRRRSAAEIAAESRRRGEEIELEKGVQVEAHIGSRALVVKTLATSFTGQPERAYYRGPQPTLEAALRFVQKHGSLDFLSPQGGLKPKGLR
jgi:hypothetical protein